MSFYVFANLTDAQALASKVDTTLGYPKLGTTIGGGVPPTALQATTFRHANVLAHPSGTQWAYPVDATNGGAVAGSATQTSKGTPAGSLDSTWQPVDPKSGQPSAVAQ